MYKLNSRRVNCMGYALNVGDWLRPKEGNVMERHEITSKNFQNMVSYLEKEYSLKRIDPKQVDSYKGKVIAFRVAEDDDFHFVVRKGRNWWHKRGSRPRIEQIRKKEVFGSAWCGMYKGEIAFLVDTVE